MIVVIAREVEIIMAIEIQILDEGDNSPPFLIIKDDDGVLSFFPVIQVQYQGKFLGTTDLAPDLRIPRTLINGVIHFYDIFNMPHIIDYTKNEPEENQWNHRVSVLDDQADKLGREKEDNPLKRMHPQLWSDVPEDEWPKWKLN